jgi:hypothetical protein
MSNKLFNTTFENALRLLILLDVFDYPQTLDMLYAVDFMAAYGATFHITTSNLNGDNQYKFSEFASRREAVKLALKELVLDGMVQAIKPERWNYIHHIFRRRRLLQFTCQRICERIQEQREAGNRKRIR